MQPLARDGLTEAQVRELLTGQSVQRRYGVDLLDTAGQVVETLADDVRGWTVVYDNNAQVHGSLSLTLGRELTWATARVRPWMELSRPDIGSARFHLGVYVLEVPDDEHGGGLRQWQVAGRNLLALLDKQVGDAYVITAGTTYLDALRALVAHAGLTIPLGLGGDRQATTLSEDQVWWNATYLDIASDLLAAIGYTDLYCTPEGQFRAVPLTASGEAPVEWTFDSRPTSAAQNADLVAESWTERQVLAGAVNRWTFVAARWVTLPIDGDGRFRYTNTDIGPTSVDALGGEVRSAAVQVIDAADQAALEAEAWRIIAADLRAEHSATIQVDPLPIAGHRDTVRLLSDGRDLTMQVSSWQVSTDGRGTWVLGGGTGGAVPERPEEQVTATVTSVSPLRILIDGADTQTPAVVLADDAGVTPSYELGRRVRTTVRNPQVPVIQGVETTT